MGIVVSQTEVKKEFIEKAASPIILCSFADRVASLLKTAGFIQPNLNLLLAEALLKHPRSKRGLVANEEVMKIASFCNGSVYFEDYQILFDPRYMLDPLKVFIALARLQKVAVKWCGQFDGQVLEYASPEYKDYRTFRVQDYDITCVN